MPQKLNANAVGHLSIFSHHPQKSVNLHLVRVNWILVGASRKQSTITPVAASKISTQHLRILSACFSWLTTNKRTSDRTIWLRNRLHPIKQKTLQQLSHQRACPLRAKNCEKIVVLHAAQTLAAKNLWQSLYALCMYVCAVINWHTNIKWPTERALHRGRCIFGVRDSKQPPRQREASISASQRTHGYTFDFFVWKVYQTVASQRWSWDA